ncbi:MAG TPA: sigma-54 dependent transcriptional regulator [Bdellovibrionota bacterium]|jgi:DNA-binding NtrC family response regulator|nr:sigma-54 dependent transcriptional regulator [Bdellovibrionota bacterium]
MKNRVLVVDDEETIRKLLKARLERDGHDVVACSGAAEAEREFATGAPVAVMVTDLKMPGKDGFELMKWAREKNHACRVVVITGHGEKDVAVRALREGASDYLEKPFDMDELSHSVRRCLKEAALETENRDLVNRLEARVERLEGRSEDRVWYVSKSPAMAKTNEWLTVLRREALRADAEEPSVLVQGESGTGKEGVARMIHTGSRRAKGPWVAVNCANFSEQLLDSELFGHERGSFTGATAQKRGLFEIAKGGTLFLDEIGEMDVKLQAKLLRVVQEKTFRRVGGTSDIACDVRVVAATNRDLQARVKEGKFRDDLYHRLGRVVIDVPSLRERSDDIIPMATQFAERAFRARGKTFEGFTPDAEQALEGYGWPGNVRELLNVIERTSLVWQGAGKVTGRVLSVPAGTGSARAEGGAKLEVVASPFQPADGPGGYMALKKQWSDQFEREYLLTALRRHNGNVSAAAREARLDRSNFLRLLRRYGLRAQEYRKAA